MSIKQSLAWMATAQLATFVLQFSSSVVLARYLTPHEMGVSAVAFAVVAVVSIAQQLGLPALIVREKVLTDEIVSTAFTINALITVLLSVTIVMIGYAGSAFMRDPGVQRVVLVLAFTPLFGIFSFLPGSNLERAGRFKEMALIGTVTGLVSAVATIALALLKFSYMSVAYAQLISAGSNAVLLAIAGREYLRHRICFTAWRRVTQFSFQMLAITGINSASDRVAEIMLGRLLNLSALGIFNRANGINGLIWNNIHGVVARVVLVDFASLHRRGAPLRDRYLHTVAIATATLWPAFAGLAVVAEPFVVLVYGERWAPAIPPFVLLAISSIITTAITMSWELFTATDQMATQTRIETVKAGFSLAAFVVGCMISLEAAAASRVLVSIFTYFIYRPYVNEMTGTRTRDFLPIYAQSMAVTLLATGPSALLMALTSSARPPLPLLAASILLGVGLWLAGLFALKHPLADEIQATVRARLPLVEQR